MKILLLCTDAYGGHGGIALFNRELCEALTRRGHEVLVVPRVMSNIPGEIPPGVSFDASAAEGRLAYMKAVARARRAKPGFVICGHIHLLPVALAFTTRPLLVTHGIEAWKPPAHALAARLVHRTRAIVSVSAVTRDRLLAWSGYRGPAFVLPNAVHLERYGIRPRRADLVKRYRLEGKRVLLTVGRLDPAERTKGFDEVLEVLPSLPDDVVYLIAGGGIDAVRLAQKARELGAGERVTFTGLFPEDEKADLYNLADLYVMPSRGEGFGFVFLEALACGLPVIGSRIDGGREALLDGRLGTLVDPANRDELSAAIAALLDRGKEVPAELSYFSFDKFVERVNDIIERA